MKLTKNTVWYVIVLVLFIFLKFIYTTLSSNELMFLLRPTKSLVEVFTGATSIFKTEEGYYFESLQIIIDKSCSGVNFLLICFLLIAWLVLGYFQRKRSKVLSIILSLFTSYLLTIIINASRILACLNFQSNIAENFYIKESVIHESIGILTNLLFLIGIYCCAKNLISKFHNEKFS